MGGSPVVSLVKKNVEKVVRVARGSSDRRPEVQKKTQIVKKTVPEKTNVSRTKMIRSTRKSKDKLLKSQMTELASVRNQRKKLLGDTEDKLAWRKNLYSQSTI